MIDRLRTKFKILRSRGRYSSLVGAAVYAYRHAKHLRTLLYLPVARRELGCETAATDQTANVEEALDTAFNGAHQIIRPLQNRSEIKSLLELLATRRPRRVLEIGTANGGTLFLFCRVAHPEATIISVDLPGGWFGGGYPTWKRSLYRQFASKQQQLHLIRADSHCRETFDRVRNLLAGEKLDFLFIDGDHTYAGVRRDYEEYRELCSDNAIIAFHDIAPNAIDPDCEVPLFWQELRRSERCVEFVEDPKQNGAGIGGDCQGRAKVVNRITPNDQSIEVL